MDDVNNTLFNVFMFDLWVEGHKTIGLMWQCESSEGAVGCVFKCLTWGCLGRCKVTAVT